MHKKSRSKLLQGACPVITLEKLKDPPKLEPGDQDDRYNQEPPKKARKPLFHV